MFLKDLRPITIFGDNEASISLAHKPVVDGHTRHINVKYHYLQREVKNGAIKLVWVSTKEQAADGLTKLFFQKDYERFCELIGLVDCTKPIKCIDAD